jgi:hypothetical protein
MAITNERATSFLAELAAGIHAPTDTYKCALIKTGHAGTYNHAVTNVGTPGTGAPSTSNLGTDEVSGAGYTAGGFSVGNMLISTNGRLVRLDFADPAALSNATFSADGFIIYNASKANRAVFVGLFPNAPRVVSGGDFQFDFPAAGDSNSLIVLGELPA